MGEYKVIIQREAQKELKKIKLSGNKVSFWKVNKMFKELSIHPRSGTGKPEKLKNDLTGLWSRRINKKDRLIYEINDKEVKVFVISALGHYDDK